MQCSLWRIVATTLGILVLTAPSHAATYYWDTSFNTAGLGTGGTNDWTTSNIWNTNSGGGSGTHVTWTDGNVGVFNGNGTVGVTVNSPISAAGSPAVAIGSSPSTGTSTTVNFSGSSSLTITSGYFGVGWQTAGGANTATVVFNQSGGIINATSSGIEIGRFGTNATYTLSSGTLNYSGIFRMANQTNGTVDPVAVLNVSGGTFSGTGQALIGNATASRAATATVNVSGTGNFSVGNLALAGATGNAAATINLNGGTIKANNVTQGAGGTGIFNFNGGQLYARQDDAAFMTGLTRANVRNGGAVINTDGYNIAIGQDLLHSNIGGDLATDGGLTKNGDGTLTLSGANTYTGPTTINVGTLLLSGAGRLGNQSDAFVAGGATLEFQTTAHGAGGTPGSYTGDLTGTGLVKIDQRTDFGGNNGSFAGTVNITSGQRLNLTATSAGSASAVWQVDGNLTNSTTGTINLGELTGSGQINTGGGSGATTFKIGGKGTSSTFSGLITNGTSTVSVEKTGSGTLTLNTAHSYSGSTTISGGTLALSGGSNRLPTGTSVNFTGSGALDVGSTSQTLADLAVATSTSNYVGTVTGSTGTVSLSGANDFLVGDQTLNGNVTLDMSGLGTFNYNGTSARTVQINSGNTSNTTAGSAAYNTTLKLAQNSTITTGNFLVGGNGTANSVNISKDEVDFGQTTLLNADNVKVGFGRNQGTLKFQTGLVDPSLTIRGSDGTSRVNTFNIGEISGGGTTTRVSTVDVTSGSVGTIDAYVNTMVVAYNTRVGSVTTPNTASFVMGAGSTLDATSLTIAKDIAGSSGAAVAIQGTVTMGGGTMKIGTLTLADRVNNTLTGTFNLNGGTLFAQTIQPGASTATRNFNFNDGTIKNYDASTNLTINSGLSAFVLASTGTHTFEIDSGRTGTINQAMSGANGTLTKAGQGLLVLAGANSYSGATDVQSGTLQLTGSLNTATTLNLGSGANSGKFILGGTGGAVNQTVAGLTTSGSGGTANAVVGGNAAISTLTVNLASGASTFAGMLGGAGTNENQLAFAKSGGGTFTLTAANTYAGSTTISGGTLALSGGNNRLPTGTTVNFTGNSTLDVGSTNQTVVDVDVANNITGTVIGSGKLTLTGSTFQLAPTVSATSQTLNLSGLTTFEYNNAAGTFRVEAGTGSNFSNSTGLLTLAPTSTITATNFWVGQQAMNSGGSGGTTATVNLGQDTTINADNIALGVYHVAGTLKYGSATSNPTLTIRGTNGGTNRATNVTLGRDSPSTINAAGTIDLVTNVTGSSTLDALIGTLTLGTNDRGSLSGGFANFSTGTFLMGGGTLDALTIVLGQITPGSTVNTAGSVHSGTFTTGAGGTVKVQNLILADNQIVPGATTAQTITGIFNLNGGAQLLAATIGPGGDGDLDFTRNRTFNFNDGTIKNYDSSTDLTINAFGGSATFALAATGTHAFDIDSGRTGTVYQAISGAGALTKLGAGTLTLATTNSYAGATAVNNGVLEVTADGALGTVAGSTSVAAGATLQFTNVNYATAESVTISGAGPGGATGAIVGQGTSTFAGNITVGGAPLSSATLFVMPGDQLTLTGGTITKDARTLIFAGGGLFTVDSQITGATDHTSDLNIDVGSTVILTNVNNNYMGPTNINNGTLQNGASNVIPNGSEVTFGSAGAASTYDLSSYSDTVRGLSSTAAGNGVVRNSVNATNSTLTLAPQGTETWTFTGVIQQNPGTVNLVMSGAAGSTQRLGGANTYAGTTTVTSGTLELFAGGLENSDISVTGGTFLQTGGLNHVTGAGPSAGNLTVNGGVYQLQGGTLDFQDYAAGGASTWTPAANQASTIALTTGADFEFTGGTLRDVSHITTTGGAGTFTQSGGNFVIGQDGAGPAALTTIDGGYSLLDGLLQLDAFGVDGTPEECCDGVAGLNDQLTVTGDAYLDSVVNIDFVDFTPVFGDVFTLICANDIVLGDNFALTGGYFRVVPTGLGPGQPQYALQAIVPEPASVAVWGVIGIAVALSVQCRRRLRKAAAGVVAARNSR